MHWLWRLAAGPKPIPSVKAPIKPTSAQFLTALKPCVTGCKSRKWTTMSWYCAGCLTARAKAGLLSMAFPPILPNCVPWASIWLTFMASTPTKACLKTVPSAKCLTPTPTIPACCKPCRSNGNNGKTTFASTGSHKKTRPSKILSANAWNGNCKKLPNCNWAKMSGKPLAPNITAWHMPLHCSKVHHKP